MNYSFHSDAQLELSAAVVWYAGQNQQLGNEFLAEVQNTISRILANPAAWTEIYGGARRCLMRRFPYSIVYQIGAGTVTIVAVMHLHRAPDYWIGRVGL